MTDDEREREQIASRTSVGAYLATLAGGAAVIEARNGTCYVTEYDENGREVERRAYSTVTIPPRPRGVLDAIISDESRALDGVVLDADYAELELRTLAIIQQHEHLDEVTRAVERHVEAVAKDVAAFAKSLRGSGTKVRGPGLSKKEQRARQAQHTGKNSRRMR